MTTSAPSINAIRFPPPGTVLDQASAAHLVAILKGWFSSCTDRVLSLESQWQTIGPDASPAEQADVAASFLAHRAIAVRMAELTAASPGSRDGAALIVELCHRPVSAEDGSAIAANLPDACALLAAILDRAEKSLAHTVSTVHESVRLRGAINRDLATADELSQRLGDQVRHISGLRSKVDAAIARQSAGGSSGELIDLAAQLAQVRTALEAADRERAALIQSWPDVPARLQRLAAQEVTIRQLRQRCEDKVRPVPKSAVPSVAAIEAPLPLADLESQPWSAMRVACRGYLTKLDRVQAALDEVQRRFAEPLRRRDELRGLVHAFHDKAGEAGLGEHPDLEPLYRCAANELWSAPCDVDRAGEMVERYIQAVNVMTQGETARAARLAPPDSTGDNAL